MAEPMSRAEFGELASRLLDDALTAEQSARLRAALVADAELRDLLVTISVQSRLLGELMTSGMTEASRDPIAEPVVVRSPRRPAGRAVVRRIGWSVAAAALAIGVTLAIYLAGAGLSENGGPEAPGRLVAVMMGSSDAEWVSRPIDNGGDVSAGPMSLASGVVQMELRGGGAVMLNGPAEVRFITPSHADLAAGWMRVRGMPGFTVDAPNGVSVIDQSTEFEVSVGPEGAVAVRVIDGRVRVVSRSGSFADRVAVTGELVAIDEQGLMVEDARRLVTVTGIDRRPMVDVHLPATGEGLSLGDADPHWSIVGAMGDEGFQPGPAVVLRDVHESYLNDRESSARWVSIDRPDGIAPGGVAYTYRVLLTLDEVDPSTLRVAGRIAVDNTVLAIRVNETPIEGFERVVEGFDRWRGFTIGGGFVRGLNVVEFDVLNAADVAVGPNPTGLLVDWTGKAMPEWIGSD